MGPSLVYVLQATATAADPTTVDEMVRNLTKDRKKFEGWHIKDTWCGSDPCDSHAMKPGNIDKTGQHYGAMKVTQLYSQAGFGSEYHFF